MHQLALPILKLFVLLHKGIDLVLNRMQSEQGHQVLRAGTWRASMSKSLFITLPRSCSM